MTADHLIAETVEKLMPPIAPRLFRDHTLADYAPETDHQRQALEAADALVGGSIRNLVLVGPPGRGKTHLAAGIVAAIARRELDAHAAALASMGDRYPAPPDLPRWLNVADAIVSMRMEFSTPAYDRSATNELLGGRTYSGLLVLDDLGRERTSDWTGEVIYALVNARYESMLPTVVTSNLTPAELAESPYWPAISRLAEGGRLVVVDGPDRRLPA